MSQLTVLPQPFVVENSGQWLGSGGSWSTFYVHIGTPAQQFHVLPHLTGQTLYVPIDKDCELLQKNNSKCGESRGVDVFRSLASPGFQANASSTWKEIGYFEMGLGRNSGLKGSALYGYDIFGPGTNNSENEIKLEKAAIAAYASTDFWVGQLGLSLFALNIGSTDPPHSLLSRMKEGKHVPSLSFGYQAGNPYKFTKVPGHLVLGGYDRSRQGNKTLTFRSVQDIIVAVQSIHTVSNGIITSLSKDGILATIDTSVDELWLPKPVCDVFASTFNLTYFKEADRYLVTDSTHLALSKTNPTISLQIGTEIGGNETLTIDFPYKAFDLQAKFPILGETANYFPLRRAANDSQYTLGRVFLQEVYLSVDWERDIFNLSQAAFHALPPPADIITIKPIDREANNPTHKPEAPSEGMRLSPGAIAGIAIAGFLFLVLITISGWWYNRRKKQVRVEPETPEDSMDEKNTNHEVLELDAIVEAPGEESKDPELCGHGIVEMYSPHGASEAEDSGKPWSSIIQIAKEDLPTPIYELPSPDVPAIEKDGVEISETRSAK